MVLENMTTQEGYSSTRSQSCYYVYLLSSLSGTLYVGLTDNLWKHKRGLFDGFTRKYKVNRLMYYETFGDSTVAAHRELQIKKWQREKKIALFAKSNSQWKDLFLEIYQAIGVPPLRQAQGRDFTQ